jgi:hypothetical protein
VQSAKIFFESLRKSRLGVKAFAGATFERGFKEAACQTPGVSS